MPSIKSPPTEVRVSAEGISLKLTVQHFLDVGQPSVVLFRARAPLPRDLDVATLAEGFSISLQASATGHSDVLEQSAVAEHIVGHLRKNAAKLGLLNVCSTRVDQLRQDIRVIVESSLESSHRAYSPLRLAAISIEYAWETDDTSSDVHNSYGFILGSKISEIHLFEGKLLLPTRALVDQAMENIISTHLIKKYPFIFSPLSKRFDVEVPTFKTITRSLLQMKSRSEDAIFVRQFDRSVEQLKRQSQSMTEVRSFTLREWLHTAGVDADEAALQAPTDQTEETSVCGAMMRVLASVVRRPQSKGIPAIAQVEALAQHDVLFELHDNHYPKHSRNSVVDAQNEKPQQSKQDLWAPWMSEAYSPLCLTPPGMLSPDPSPAVLGPSCLANTLHYCGEGEIASIPALDCQQTTFLEEENLFDDSDEDADFLDDNSQSQDTEYATPRPLPHQPSVPMCTPRLVSSLNDTSNFLARPLPKSLSHLRQIQAASCNIPNTTAILAYSDGTSEMHHSDYSCYSSQPRPSFLPRDLGRTADNQHLSDAELMNFDEDFDDNLFKAI